jgi:hypothetical protein
VPDTISFRETHHLARTEIDGSFFIPLVGDVYAIHVYAGEYAVKTVTIRVPDWGVECIVVRLRQTSERATKAGDCKGLSWRLP